MTTFVSHSSDNLLADTLLPLAEFAQRRAKFLAQMPKASLAVFASAEQVTRSNDTEFPFCQDKNFYYLTGFNEPNAFLLLRKSSTGKTKSCLVCWQKDPLMEVWHGRRAGPDLAKTVYGFDHAYPLTELDETIAEYINNTAQLWSCRDQDTRLEQQISQWLLTSDRLQRQGVVSPKIRFDCTAVLAEMRVIKSDAELAIMRQVNIISGVAHQRAMLKAKQGGFEYQLEAEILHAFANKGARYPAYGTIVASGDNANILHYTANNCRLCSGDLILIDAGGELAGYAADITRTFPVNGQFSAEQKSLYLLILDAQQQAIEAIKPKQTLAALNELVCNVLTKGLLKLGILTGDLAQLNRDKACKKYFIHGLGHWLGLDVHDVGDYQIKDKQQTRGFQPGMVMTIEPGIYIPENDMTVDQKWRGIGIRIEDNIAVTDTGYENLTINAPKSVADIEALMQQKMPAVAQPEVSTDEI